MTELLIGVAIAAAAFVAGIVYSSFFEWVLHRHIMHSKRFLSYPHRAHELEHHGIFKADATYFLAGELHEPGDEKHLTFAWWNAPLLIFLHAPIFAGFFFLLGVWGLIGVLAAMISYYFLYEYLHYCMHVPRQRWLERTWFFAFIQRHHRLHHVYYYRNLNVVLPIADLVLGTLAPRGEGLFEKLEAVRLERENRRREKLGV
jgi:hypothetical protein